MMEVLCSTVELEEYGEVISVGDRTERIAARSRGGHYGNELDSVPWAFDRYGGLSSGDTSLVSGQVVAIAAIYVRLTLRANRRWVPAPGSARLESIETTADTRRPAPRIEWGPASDPDEHGRSYRGGYQVIREGEEHLSGWRVTLEHEQVIIDSAAGA